MRYVKHINILGYTPSVNCRAFWC